MEITYRHNFFNVHGKCLKSNSPKMCTWGYTWVYYKFTYLRMHNKCILIENSKKIYYSSVSWNVLVQLSSVVQSCLRLCWSLPNSDMHSQPVVTVDKKVLLQKSMNCWLIFSFMLMTKRYMKQ